MATVQLLASAYSETYTSVTNPSNAYTDTDSTSYASVQGTRSTTGEAYFAGFDFSQIPSNATVTDVEYKIKASASATSANRYVCLANASTTAHLSDTTDLTTTATVYELSPTSLTWSEIVALGNDFGFGVRTTGTTQTVYVYGMEINVTYTVPEPKPNKIVYNGNTLIDLTGDDVTAADVASGVLFHLATGEQATGTGGGGLKYETGTWTPTSNVETGSITFANAHDEPPTIVVVSANVDSASQNYTMMRMIVVDYCKISNLDGTATGLVSGLLAVNRRATSSTTYQASTTILKKGGASTSTDYQSFRAYATASGITVYGTSSYYWRANVPCSWIAIWT